MRREDGFTLIELLVTMSIAVMLMMAIYGAVNMAQRSSQGIERKVTAQQDARTALELMAMEIRMASYNPNFVTGIWVKADPPNAPPQGSAATDCGTSSTNQTYQGIQRATPNEIAIEMDINENSVVAANSGNPNEIIHYVYDPLNLYIARRTNCGTAQPFLGDTATPREVRVINDINANGAYDAGVDIPVFRYFDGNGNEITNLPAAIPDIRRIEITLVAETEHIDPTTSQRRRLVYSTGVTLRNHVAN